MYRLSEGQRLCELIETWNEFKYIVMNGRLIVRVVIGLYQYREQFRNRGIQVEVFRNGRLKLKIW